MRKLLQAGQDLHARDDSGCTPLHVACVHRRDTLVRWASRFRTASTSTTKDACSPRLLCLTDSALLARGASVNATTHSNDTPLHYAAFADHIGIVKLVSVH